MDDTNVAVATPQVQSEAPPVAPASPQDPFALDEASLASLSPEQRASLDPILDGWRQKAKSEIDRASKSAEETYKPLKEKAEALDKLVGWSPFQQFWANQQKAMMQGQSAETKEAIAQAKPQDFASSEEWAQAVIDASNGDPSKFQAIQQRMWSMMATPVVQQLQSKQREIETSLEMKDLMESHPDYKELDRIGLDEKGEGTSLLEHCLNWAESNRRPLEEGYRMARRWADQMKSGAKAEAMGLVQNKRESVTAGPSTSSASGQVVFVDSQDELIRKSMEAALEGQKNIRFELRQPAKK